MAPSASVEAAIERWVMRLEHRYDRIQRCSVVIDIPHHHHLRGNLFHVRIELAVPGLEIVVSHDPSRDRGHRDVYLALGDAFRAVFRQLHDDVAVRRNVGGHLGP